MDKRYVIVNRNNRPLDGFYSNGGWEIRDVFAFSLIRYMTFPTREEAENHLLYMRSECMAQKDRWGSWLEKALTFLKTLRVIAYSN